MHAYLIPRQWWPYCVKALHWVSFIFCPREIGLMMLEVLEVDLRLFIEMGLFALLTEDFVENC